MKPHSLLCSAAMALVVCLPACRAGREVSDQEGGSRLDPTSVGSRKKLDAAQQAFGNSGSGGNVFGGGDLGMTSFRTGGGAIAMPGFATKNLQMKGARGMSSYRGDTGASEFNNRSFSSGSSTFKTGVSGSSNLAADIGGSNFAVKSYRTRSFRTKAYRGANRGFRLPSGRGAKVTPVEALMESSNSEPGGASVGDIRNLLNR